MRHVLIVSNRGQITLPVSLRKRFGIKNGGVVILEERSNEMVLKPETMLPVEGYTDEQISAWEEADHLDDMDRTRLLKRLGKTK